MTLPRDLTARRGNLRERRREARRAELLAAASRLLVQDGEGFAVHDLAEAVGCGIGTVYRHFDSRDDVVDSALASQLDTLRLALAETGDPRHPLTRALGMLRRITVAACEDPRSVGQLVLVLTGVSRSTTRPKTSMVAQRITSGLRLCLMSSVDWSRGETRRNVDAAVSAVAAAALACDDPVLLREVALACLRSLNVTDDDLASARTEAWPIDPHGRSSVGRGQR